MSVRSELRWPGDPSGGDATFGPLVGLPDAVYFFVKDRQRRRDAEAHRLAQAARRLRLNRGWAGSIALAGGMHRLATLVRHRLESSTFRR